MKIKKIKMVALATIAGGTVLGGGCIGGLPWQQLLWFSAAEIGLEFVTDNDAVFDLFEDGAVGTAADDGA